MKHILFILVIFIFGLNTQALIKLKLDLFETSAAVVRMKVTGVNAENQVVDLEQVEVSAGEYAGKTGQLQIPNMKSVFEKVKKETPAIVFKSRRGTLDVAHIADTWLIVKLNDNKTAWIAQSEKKDLYPVFPASTDMLEQLIVNHKEKKDPILETLEEKEVYSAKPRPLGQAPEGTQSLFSDLDFLIFLSKDKPRFQKLTSKGLEDHPGSDILVDFLNSEWIELKTPEKQVYFRAHNGDFRLMKESDPKEPPLPISLAILAKPSPQKAARARFLNGKKLGLMIAEKASLTIQSVNGSMSPIDFTRLTGKKWADVLPEKIDFSQSVLFALDINKDNLDDVMILWKEGGVLLVNRGYNCFFVSDTPVKNLRESAKTVGINLDECQMTPTSLGMVLMGKTGNLFLIGNLVNDESR